METKYKDKIFNLRKCVPVGIKEAYELLLKTDGDIEKSIEIFKTRQLKIIMSKTGIEKDIALMHLQKNNFDISPTVESINNERYTAIEKILHRHKNNKENALNMLLYHFEDTVSQSPETARILAVIEWLNYLDYEGLDYAIYFNFDIITDSIANQLLMPETAAVLKKAKKIHMEQYEEQQAKYKKNGCISHTDEFSEQMKLFEKQKHALIDRIYEFFQTNNFMGVDYLIIEKANFGDLPEILSLQKIAYQSEAILVNDFTIPPLLETIESVENEFNSGVILKVECDGKIIGSVRCKNSGNTVYIGKLIVHPDFQNKGIGTALLLYPEKLFPRMRYELFTSSKSDKSLYLYTKNGYSEFKREPLNKHADIIFLEKYGQEQ